MTDANRCTEYMDAELETIRQQAEHWCARRRDAVRPAADETAFNRWLDASAIHQVEYAKTERAWAELGGLQASARMREMAGAAMRSSGRRQPMSLWKPLLLAASVAALAVTGALMWWLPRDATAPHVVAYRTALGEQRTEQLDDGTRITLNTDTLLEVRYANARRDVVLRQGEALFSVAKDSKRPFVVAAADGTVTALGTQFQVRELGGDVSVTLLEGSVEVARVGQGERQRMVPGDQATFHTSLRGIALRRVDPAAAIDWTQGRLNFRGTPLAEAVSEANRYSAQKLRLGDPALTGLLVSGSFRTGDNAGIAVALSAAFPVRIADRSDSEILLQGRNHR